MRFRLPMQRPVGHPTEPARVTIRALIAYPTMLTRLRTAAIHTLKPNAPMLAHSRAPTLDTLNAPAPMPTYGVFIPLIKAIFYRVELYNPRVFDGAQPLLRHGRRCRLEQQDIEVANADGPHVIIEASRLTLIGRQPMFCHPLRKGLECGADIHLVVDIVNDLVDPAESLYAHWCRYMSAPIITCRAQY